MPINTVIRNKRKELGLTQEQIADYLGVSAPAVNKWEKGVTFPDISLLSPLARILKIDLNTLLCFEENLTSTEITKFGVDIVHCIEKEGFESGFKMANDKIKEYPNCTALIESIATFLDGSLMIYGSKLPNKAYYEEKIFSLYERVAACDDEKIRNKALYMLVSKYITKEDYEKAQQMLDLLPERTALDKKQLQATLWKKQDKPEAAAEIMGRKLLSEINEIQMTIFSLVDSELALENYEKAEKLSDILRELVNQFDLWDYNAHVIPLLIASHKKDVHQTISILRSILEMLLKPWVPQNSILYSYMKKSDKKSEDTASDADTNASNVATQPKSNDFGAKMLPSLLTDLETNSDYDYLRSDDEFLELIQEYSKKCFKSNG